MHEDFICQAIESVLTQETSYPFELVIANDHSTDSTDEIIKKIINEHPKGHLIRYFNHTINKGMMKNFIFSLEQCQGEYVALCEGDDYWTDPLKLQKQVDLLESNSNLVACHHWQKNAILKDGFFVETESPKKGHGYFPQPVSNVIEIFSNNLRIKTRTIMFRNVINKDFFPTWFSNLSFGDVPLSFLLGKFGDFGFIDEEMAVYRQTETGVSKAGLKELGRKKFRVQHFKNWIEIWDYVNVYYNYEYHKESVKTVSDFYKVIFLNLEITVFSFLLLLKYNVMERKLSVIKTFPHTKMIILFFGKKVGAKIKRKLLFK